MRKNNIKKIETKEEDGFDPSIHEAIEVKESNSIKKEKHYFITLSSNSRSVVSMNESEPRSPFPWSI